MKTLSNENYTTFNEYNTEGLRGDEIVTSFEKVDQFKNFFRHRQANLDELLTKLTASTGKKSFLVFRHNKYITVSTDNIAFFCIKYESSVIVCFDRQEYSVNYSLEQIQNLLSKKQFFRLNRQYLINFTAVKDVEHYFARKLLVNPVIPTKDKLLVAKERVTEFFHWLDDR